MSDASPTTPGFLFAGGGTGGHLFPALACLEQLVAICQNQHIPFDPDIHTRFLCSTRKIDARILSKANVPFAPIPAAPLGASPHKLVRFVSHWGRAVRAARAHMRELSQRCDHITVLATGGFVAAPIVQAARAERHRIVMLNQDTPPGKANRWIARHAHAVLTTTPINPHDPRQKQWQSIGPVVRSAALAPADQSGCKTRLKLDPTKPVLFVTGASQGASSINNFVQLFVRRHAEQLVSTGWQLIHQTGQRDNTDLIETYATGAIPAVVEPFFDAMGVCWGAADCAISRAGAGTVAEVRANAVPTLFLPYPYHRDAHQRFNAQPLVDAGAAILGTDHIDPAHNEQTLGPVLLDLLADAHKRNDMKHAFASLGPVDGSRTLARSLMG